MVPLVPSTFDIVALTKEPWDAVKLVLERLPRVLEVADKVVARALPRVALDETTRLLVVIVFVLRIFADVTRLVLNKLEMREVVVILVDIRLVEVTLVVIEFDEVRLRVVMLPDDMENAVVVVVWATLRMAEFAERLVELICEAFSCADRRIPMVPELLMTLVLMRDPVDTTEARRLEMVELVKDEEGALRAVKLALPLMVILPTVTLPMMEASCETFRFFAMVMPPCMDRAVFSVELIETMVWMSNELLSKDSSLMEIKGFVPFPMTSLFAENDVLPVPP
jgi:hypothetical protein